MDLPYKHKDMQNTASNLGDVEVLQVCVTLIRINKGHRDCQTPGIRHFIGLETM